MEAFNDFLSSVNAVIWHDYVLYIVLGVGILFTLWSGFCQYRALTHGVAVIRGKYDDHDEPGAINHFQALSAALSATVGLGNIGGVAVAVALGGPGAVFWMWMIGLAGMALKLTEVSLTMLYRNASDPDNPSGGPMWVAAEGFKERGMAGIGKLVGGIFCVTLLISAVTGGNMFQAWNVGEVTQDALGVPTVATGILLAVVVGAVIIGGIKRIGSVAGYLVPFMCALYLAAAGYVLIMNAGAIPEAFGLIVSSAFSPLEAEGAFIGGTFGYAFLWGMKRALFSSEAGQGSSPIAHAAAKTKEPIREAVVAGLEPFIDTLVVCTLTALVILTSGAWKRDGETKLVSMPAFTQVDDTHWTLGTTELPAKSADALKVTGSDWRAEDAVFVLARWGKAQDDTGDTIHRVAGRVTEGENKKFSVTWEPVETDKGDTPKLMGTDVYREYPGATLTSHAFDRTTPGLGKWLILLASWLFAISTMISWSYYGEKGMVFLLGEGSVLPYKLAYCSLIVVACLGFIETDAELDNLTALGTGVMLWANIPIMLIFGAIAMRAYKGYMSRLDSGDFKAGPARSLEDMQDD